MRAAIWAFFAIFAKIALGTIGAKFAGKAVLTKTLATTIEPLYGRAVRAAIWHRVAIWAKVASGTFIAKIAAKTGQAITLAAAREAINAGAI